MTYEEAILRIRHHMIFHNIDEPRAIQISVALDMAIETMSKQIPKEAPIKPLYFEGNPEPIDYMVYCPDCDEPICYPTEYEAKEYYQYCPHCGRRIEWDWSDEE